MARRDNAYSRLVGWLKIGLPLTALALLSMVFLVSRTLDPEDALPYAQVDIAELLRDPRLTAPTFSGMTRQGDEVEFTAEAAHPRGTAEGGARAVKPVLRLISPEGTTTEVRAAEARLQPAENRLRLSGQVEITTRGDYRLQSDELLAALDQSRLESPGPVAATAPLSEITADTMLLSRQSREEPEVLVFKGAVRLIYHPADAASAPPPGDSSPAPPPAPAAPSAP